MSLDDRLGDALTRALADARVRLEPELRTLADELGDARAVELASAAQTLDGADSLTGVLQALLDAASRQCDRAGIFLATGGRTRPWQLRGIDEAAPSTPGAPGLTTFPLSVGGSVVAVLCVQGGAGRGALDVLVRYAGRRLESMTLQAALGMTAR